MLSFYISILEFLGLCVLMWFLLTKRGRQVFRGLKKSVKQGIEKVKARRQRHWHPKSEADCPHCQSGVKLKVVRGGGEVVAWSERKGVGGRRKVFETEGFACLNEECAYFGVRDACVHALVKDTDRGKDRDIVQLRCQCCRKRFSSRKGTPLYYLKKKAGEVEFVLWFSAEGVDASVLVRYTGYDEETIGRWLKRAGSHSSQLHEWLFRGLVLPLVQMDELYARVKGAGGGSWLWLALDPISKALPALHLGGRKAEDGYALVHELKLRLAPDCVPAVTTDGLRAYFSALTAHFGSWFRPKGARTDHWQVDERLTYGQLVKRREKQQVNWTVRRMCCGERGALYRVLEANGFSPNIQTAFIERINLTIRQGISLLTRKTWSLAQSEEQLLVHVEWWRAYYHFVRPHETLGEVLPGYKCKRRPKTPAMALGLTDEVWTVGQILRMSLPPMAAVA